jgi:hypothetical protein
MMDARIFPTVNRLHPSYRILGIKEAWKFGIGWINKKKEMPTMAFLKNLKAKGYTKINLCLENPKTKQITCVDYSVRELVDDTKL